NPLLVDVDHFDGLQDMIPGELTPAQRLRLWQLLHWRDQPVAGVGRMRPELEYLLVGLSQGAANETDAYDHLLGPQMDSFRDLSRLSGRWGEDDRQRCPAIVPVVDRIR